MNIFLFEDYKPLLRAKISAMPKKGRGQIEQMAAALNVHQSFISQVLNTSRNFSEEQALIIAQHFQLKERETEFFIALVQRERASSKELRNILTKNIQRIRTRGEPSASLDRSMTSLAEEDKQVFYSHWHYMAVWLLTAIEKLDSVEKISKHLHVPLSRVREIVEFLVHVGLCSEKNGKLSIQVLRTLVTRGSPMLSRHHINWRLRSMDVMQMEPSNSLFYTQPMTISEKDAKIIHEILIKSISVIEPLVEPSPSEKTFCLNIDWFEF